MAPESRFHSSLETSEEESLRSAGWSSGGGAIGEDLEVAKDVAGLDAVMEVERLGLLGAEMRVGSSAWTVFSYLSPKRPNSSLKGIAKDGRRFEDRRRLENFGGDIVWDAVRAPGREQRVVLAGLEAWVRIW